MCPRRNPHAVASVRCQATTLAARFCSQMALAAIRPLKSPPGPVGTPVRAIGVERSAPDSAIVVLEPAALNGAYEVRRRLRMHEHVPAAAMGAIWLAAPTPGDDPAIEMVVRGKHAEIPRGRFHCPNVAGQPV